MEESDDVEKEFGNAGVLKGLVSKSEPMIDKLCAYGFGDK
jgi:hypothetical protein